MPNLSFLGVEFDKLEIHGNSVCSGVDGDETRFLIARRFAITWPMSCGKNFDTELINKEGDVEAQLRFTAGTIDLWLGTMHPHATSRVNKTGNL